MKNKRITKITDENKLSANYPELLVEWDYNKNNISEIYPDKITSKNQKKVWWVCSKCGNEWITSISTRTVNKSGCPECNKGLTKYNRSEFKDNYISIKFPHLIKEWNFEKNSNLFTFNKKPVMPDTYKAYTKNRVWWVCSTCGHEYQRELLERTKFNIGCPECKRNEKLKTCIDCNKIYNPSKEFVGEDKNYSDGRCKKCYKKFIELKKEKKKEDSLIRKHKKTLSTEKRLLKNSNPELFKCIHPKKNTAINFENIFPNSKYYIWWICPNCKEEVYESVANMSKRKVCKKCVAKNSSFIERKFYYFTEKVFGVENVENTYKFITKDNKKIEIDIFIKSLNLGIEYDGVYFHKDKHEKDFQKNIVLDENKINLIRIREFGLKKIKSYDVVHDFRQKHFKKTFKLLFLYIKKNFNVEKSYINIFNEIVKEDLEDFSLPKEYLVYPLKKDSLLQKNPNLCKNWDYEKNYPLLPQMFSLNSTTKMWWVCKSCNEAFFISAKSLNRRVYDCLCDKCIKTKIAKENKKSFKNSILDFNPNLKKWVSEKENKNLDEIARSSNESILFECPECNFEFYEKAITASRKHEKKFCPNRENHEGWVDAKTFYKRNQKKYGKKFFISEMQRQGEIF